MDYTVYWFPKSADFTFDLGSLTLLVESKSALICLDVKQQIPNLHNADIFFERTISKAYKQLNSSYVRLSVSSKNPIIKIILLYDQFSNSAIVEEAAHKILGSDSSCFIMTIREFEILLYLHQHNKETEQQILDEILKSSRAENSRKIFLPSIRISPLIVILTLRKKWIIFQS